MLGFAVTGFFIGRKFGSDLVNAVPNFRPETRAQCEDEDQFIL